MNVGHALRVTRAQVVLFVIKSSIGFDEKKESTRWQSNACRRKNGEKVSMKMRRWVE